MQYSTKALFDMLTLFFIAIGAILMGIVGVYHLIARDGNAMLSVIFILFGVAALFHMFSRDYYLPFLGRAAYPCGTLVEKAPPNADLHVDVTTSPNVNVIYWVSDKVNDGQVAKNPLIVYEKDGNSGVTLSDGNGKATLHIRKPKPVMSGMSSHLPLHVHYRACNEPGMMSSVQTMFL
jgi:uncharacterized membrane protein YuzA (DUF378 family)